MTTLAGRLEDNQFAYLTTVGRVSGEPHRIEIWFVVIEGSAWVLSGGRDRSDWVQNLIAEPHLEIEIGPHRWRAVARVHPEAGEHAARQRLAQRYQGWEPGCVSDHPIPTSGIIENRHGVGCLTGGG